MKYAKLPFPILYILLFYGCLTSCKKDFLDASPNKSLAIPESLQDFQSLLDDQSIYSGDPSLADISSDDYYVTYSYLMAQQYFVQDCYTWASNTYAGGSGTAVQDWNRPYSTIYTANVVLDALPGFPPDPSTLASWNAIKGSALYYRAFNYYNLAQVFAPPYKPASNVSDIGLPLNLTSDLTAPVSRSTVQATYDQIIQDLLQAKDLLPITVSTTYLNRPSKPAALALLARTYLVMQDYFNAWKYADSCLQSYNTLMDYNTISPTPTLPFPNPPSEVLVQSYELYPGILGSFSSTSYVDSSLYSSYADNDLRKSLFFKLNNTTHLPYFRGNYSNVSYLFDGMAIDEVYLIRAECNARTNQTAAALDDLNSLLIKRWKTGTFTPYTMANTSNILQFILTERRKELCFRGIRWTDLRRLNQDPNTAVTPTRVLNGQTYTLPPSDPRYTLLIPLDEILYGKIAQNQR
jgi:hypothetical protein